MIINHIIIATKETKVAQTIGFIREVDLSWKNPQAHIEIQAKIVKIIQLFIFTYLKNIV